MVDLTRDFRSDTVTQPTEGMKSAMTSAPLGDDVFGEDQTTQALQQRVADLTGKEAGLFFPSGSMANLAALMVQAEPGSILYAGSRSHIKLFELGSYARIAGLSLIDIEDKTACLDLAQLKQAWSPDLYYMPKPGIVTVENTHNILGGQIYPLDALARLSAFAREKRTPIHMDGARLLHAATAMNEPVTRWANHVDTVMISISKGLGAPVGSVLAGSQGVIEKARAVRKLLGGGLRQSGVLSAAGIYALDHHFDLLKTDHRRCRQVYEGIENLPWLTATPPQTNILIVNLESPRATDLVSHLAASGIHCLALGDAVLRLVFHHHINDEACSGVVRCFRTWS